MNVVDSGDNEVWRAYSRKVESEECCDEDGAGGEVEPDCGALSRSDCEGNLGGALARCRIVRVTNIDFHLRQQEVESRLLMFRCRRSREGNM